MAVAVIVLTGHRYLLPYAITLGTVLLVLYRSVRYREHPQRHLFDRIFLAYLWTIIVIRCRPFRGSGPVEQVLNIYEHIGFAMVIGLLVHLLFVLLSGWPHRKALIAGSIAFNLLGIVNELFQDAIGGDVLQGFDIDAWKDLAMNAVGSALLVLFLRPGQAHSTGSGRTRPGAQAMPFSPPRSAAGLQDRSGA